MVTDALPRPGAKVVLGSINNRTGQTFSFGVEAELRAALVSQLQKHGLAAEPVAGLGDFLFNLDITDFSEGSAFKRWLVPGWGCTVLAMEGSLIDKESKKLAAKIRIQRTVAVGGFYTLGAEHTILKDAARDVAHDLQLRISKGGEFVLEARSRAGGIQVVQPAADATTVWLTDVTDARAESGRIGERFAAFGASMGDIYFSRSVPDYLRENLELELTAAGCRLTATNAAVQLKCSVNQFWVTTMTTPLYWDVIANVSITVSDAARPTASPQSFTATCSKRTYVWPTASHCEEALGESIADIMKQFRESQLRR